MPSSGPAPLPPPAPYASTADAASNSRIVGLPALVFSGFCACVAFTLCAAVSHLRRRCQAARHARLHGQAVSNPLNSQELQRLRASSGSAVLPPVRGTPLALPWPPVHGVAAYDLLGELGQARFDQATLARVVRRVWSRRDQCIAHASAEAMPPPRAPFTQVFSARAVV